LETKRLAAFIKVVDLGSLTKAANVLRTAQPALSQQIAALEAEFKQQLLIRSPRGVVPTEAGQVLYRHAQSILRQVDEVRTSIGTCRPARSGSVRVGLAPFSTATTLALPLLREVRRAHAGSVLHIRVYFGTVLCELVLKGQLDMAVLYGNNPPRGLIFTPVMKEEWFLVTPATELAGAADEPVAIEALASLDLLLPTKTTFLRGTVEAACAQAGFTPRVVAEIESPAVLSAALAAGMGSTILPWSMAMAVQREPQLIIRRIAAPMLEAPMAICIADSGPLSDAAMTVYDILVAEIEVLANRRDGPGTAG
jgi:LysR family nitrogen assimilation transcriptional regulator